MAGRRSALGVAATATPLAVQGGSPEAVPRKRRYAAGNFIVLETQETQAAKSPQPKLSRQPASANAWMSGVITSMNSKKQAASSLTKHVAADGARYAAPSALGQAKGCPAVPTGEASEATSLRVAAADGRGYGELDRRQSSKLARSVTAGVMGSRKLRSASAASGSSRGRGEGGGKSSESKAALARRSSDTGPELCAPVKDTRQLTEARASFTAKLALQTELDRELAASCAHFASLRAQYTAYGEESAPERANADAGEPTGGTDTGAQIRSAVTVGGSVGGGRGAAADHKGGQNKKAVLEKRMLGYYRHNRLTLEKSLLMYETVRKELLSIKAAIAAYKRRLVPLAGECTRYLRVCTAGELLMQSSFVHVAERRTR